MSTLKVTLERLRILPHPNADALELAEVGLYRAVVRKGEYKTGDYALYIPEQALLPAELVEELGLTGRLAGPEKNRVKAVRLRGELSQGIVCRPASVALDWNNDDGRRFLAELGQQMGDSRDFAEELGITKWEPPIPVGMAGDVEAAPHLLRWIEIENIKRYPTMFEPGEEVVATEKIHGTCFLLTYDVEEDKILVSSKGMGGKNLALKESDSNLYWRAARQYDLPAVARQLADTYNVIRVGLYGEVYGKGVQDLHYGRDAGHDDRLGFALFDVMLQPKLTPAYFIDAEFFTLKMRNTEFLVRGILPTAPVLYHGPYDYELLAKLAEGKETISGRELHVREGLVVRPRQEARSEETGSRKIAKFINPDYLTRGGGATEYE